MKTTYFVRLFIYFFSSCVVLKNGRIRALLVTVVGKEEEGIVWIIFLLLLN